MAIAQLLEMKAKSILSAQKRAPRGVVASLMLSGMVVRVLWVPSGMQPANLLSRLQANFSGDKMRAERVAYLNYRRLLRDTSVVEFRGVLCLGRGMSS